MGAFVVAAIFGAFVGSFLNVCIHRLPRSQSVVSPPSRCYACGTHVQWYDNVPVLSWLLLRGRCRWCGSTFSMRYLCVEIAVALASGLVVWGAMSGHLVGAPWIAAAMPAPWPAAIAAASLLVLLWMMVVATVTDLEHMIIPDEVTKSLQLAAPWLALLCGSNVAIAWHPGDLLLRQPFPGEMVLTPGRFLGWTAIPSTVALVLLAASLPLARAIYSRYVPEGQRWTEDDHRGFRIGAWWFLAATLPVVVALVAVVVAGGGIETSVLRLPGAAPGAAWQLLPLWAPCAVQLAQALLGSLAGWWSLYLVGMVGTVVFRKNAMGFGDVKLLAPIGAFVGPIGVLYTFLMAAVVGTLVGLPLRLMGGRHEIPFGPFLVAGAFATLAFGPVLDRLLLAWIGR